MQRVLKIQKSKGMKKNKGIVRMQRMQRVQ